MAHNISFDYFTSINGIWWTLPIEFSFYLVLPALALLLRRRRWPILLVGAVVFTFFYRYLMFSWVAKESVPYKVWVLEQLPGRIDQFVFGMLAAYFFMESRRAGILNQRQSKPFSPTAFIILGMIGVICFLYLIHIYILKYWDGHFLLFVWHGCVGFFIALVIYGIAKNSLLGIFLFGNRLILKAGVISYSIYLWHQLVITWIMDLGYFGHVKGYLFLPILIVTLPVSLGLAMVSYLVIERPFLMSRLGKG